MSKFKYWVALVAALVLGGVGLVGLPAQASPTEPPGNVCEGTPEIIKHKWQKQKRTRVWIDGSDEVSHLVYSYKQTVQDFKTKYQYQKQVKGNVWQRDNGQGSWHNTGQSFDWTWWSPAS